MKAKVFGSQSTANENWCCEWKWRQGYFEVSRQPIKIGVASGSAGRGVLMSIDINENWRVKTYGTCPTASVLHLLVCLLVLAQHVIIIIIMNIYHVLINVLSAHMIHINLNMVCYTHVERSPTKTRYIKY